ncbi:MAG: dephospho-CoA kinase [Candidatus Gastranaerophilaceae bacterium]
MLKIAIVGNIACGKSTVENILKQIGFVVFDTDVLAHSILEDNADKVIEYFREFDITDEKNCISRKKLGDVVFKDKNLKKRLENIIYPILKQEIRNKFIENSDKDYVFISIPLLFEVGWQNEFDKILFIKTDDDIRLERLMKRNSLTREDALYRLNSQLGQEEKILKSDFVICNNTNISDLQNEINKFIILLRTMEHK